ncbi:MAG: cytosine permease [Candidatus Nephthysia bennettiae]|uniref:Cytosine permease n=1 Tax=Candidatus Nephthysia bennettiae TaxID=3127016 RepID=A0A934K7K7_9BACT|nr:cytosine permease [Candidatus Dormibacteraeota bacterium]MBJ7614942.1 cytosine permease [Candidatus Dormibacteraeota bacterium]PZR99946.1 MAG: cytosine permease [Candidatus Dormibacteraeota bacterium]
MAISEEIGSDVPIREGHYGKRVAAVEPGGIEYIADEERHGRPLDLFWTWMSPNLEFATIFVGVIPVALLGGSFWTGVAAVVVGTALGSLTHAILSSWGPKFGVPQLVESRSAFGYWGNLLPAGLQSVTASIGWFIVNSVSGAFALQTLFALLKLPALPFGLAFGIIVLAQVAVAFFGYNMAHTFERYAFPYLTIVFALCLVFILSKANFGQGLNPKVNGPLGQTGAFILGAMAAYGYAVGWNPYASDYTRYLPRTASRLRTGLAAGLGVFVSCVVLETMGAALATVAGTKWGPNDIPTTQFSAALPTWLAILASLGIALGAVAANVINIYSGALSFLTLNIRLPFRQRRAIVAVVAGAIGLLIGIVFQAQVGPGGKYEYFLLLISYWISPFLGVVITDYWIRRGRIRESTFFDPSHQPWRGLVAFLAGVIAGVPFWNQPAFFVGPVPANNPAVGDLTFIVGFVVAAAVNLALNLGARSRSASSS